ncbi:MAG: hypothetical protein AMXMBFR78_06440 [Rubrivivax sp.]|jgi:hypothetical protein|nr:ribbon-helix-helix protein, CopG family [Rubrivivax sp.]
MRTISIRLDDRTDALFRLSCERLGLSQTDALKAAIEHLAERQRPTPAELAAQLGLIGSFRSGHSDRAVEHSREVKQRLRAKLASDGAGRRA